jgi:hypothetical protein
MRRNHSSADLQRRIDNADGHVVQARIVGVDEATCTTLRTAYEHLLGEMPHDRSLFDVGQLV